MIRILVIVPFPMSENNLAQRRKQLASVTLDTDTVVEYRPVRVAPSNYVSGHDNVIAELSIVDAGMNAEQEGFDAVCIDTMSDTGVAVLRSLLRIPVIGPGRHSMLAALSLGKSFSIITMWDAWRPLYEKTILELGLSRHCASVRAANIPPDNRNLLAGKEDYAYPRLEHVAKQCIEEDGAQVLILGSTTMHDIHGWLAPRLPVPLINPGPLTYSLAESAVRQGLKHSRQRYPRGNHDAALIRRIASAGAAADIPPAAPESQET